MDSGDKATSKAMTIAYRTALVQMFSIATGGNESSSLPTSRQGPAALQEPPPATVPKLTPAEHKTVEILQWARKNKLSFEVIAAEFKSFTNGGSLKTAKDIKVIEKFFVHVCSSFVDQKKTEHQTDEAIAKDATESKPITDPQLKRIMAMFNELGITDREPRLAMASKVIGRAVGSAKELTRDEAGKLIEDLKAQAAVPTAEASDELPNSEAPAGASATSEVLDVMTSDTESETETFLATPEIIEDIKEKLESMGLTAAGRTRFLREVTGKPFIKSFTDSDWLKVSQRVEAALNAEEVLPDKWYAGSVVSS